MCLFLVEAYLHASIPPERRKELVRFVPVVAFTNFNN